MYTDSYQRVTNCINSPAQHLTFPHPVARRREDNSGINGFSFIKDETASSEWKHTHVPFMCTDSQTSTDGHFRHKKGETASCCTLFWRACRQAWNNHYQEGWVFAFGKQKECVTLISGLKSEPHLSFTFSMYAAILLLPPSLCFNNYSPFIHSCFLPAHHYNSYIHKSQ